MRKIPDYTYFAMKPRSIAQTIFSRKGRTGRLIKLFVFVPTILIWVYLTFIHSNMYVSTSQFALRNNDSSDLPSIAGMFFQNASSTVLDAFVIQRYITSMDMLEKVNKTVDLQAHYGSRKRDIVSRLRANPTREKFHEYWQWAVRPEFNQEKGILKVEVKAYTPEMAQAVNRLILSLSEELVNQINDRAHKDALQLTQNELAIAEEKVLIAEERLREFRESQAILNPQATAAGLQGIITGLEGEVAALQAELSASLQVMQPTSPKIQNLRTKISGLQQQIANEKSRIAGAPQEVDGSLSGIVGEYARLHTEETFARERLVKAMTALEVARLKAISQSRYIVPFEPPTLPDEATYPEPLLMTTFAFFALLIGLGIISLVIAAIRDHMGV